MNKPSQFDQWFPTFSTRWKSFLSISHPFRRWWPCYTTEYQQRTLLRLVVTAVEEKVPLLPLLECFYEDQRGAFQGQLEKLLTFMRQGDTFIMAAEKLPGLIGEEDLVALRFDAHLGTQTAAARERLSEHSVLGQAVRLKSAWVYFCVLTPLGLILASFTQLSLAPKIRGIMNEFVTAASLPRTSFWHIPGITWAAVIIGFVVTVLWLSFTRNGNQLRRNIVRRFFPSLNDERCADLLAMINVAANAGRPLPSALSTLARYHVDADFRQRLLFARNEVEQGVDVWDSLFRVGLLSVAEKELLLTAERLGNRVWTISQIIDLKRTKASRATDRMANIFLPIPIVVIASLVVFEVTHVIQPLITVITISSQF